LREGKPETAIRCFEKALEADPSFTRCHLSLAAAHLERGDPERSCAHLRIYVAAHPENLAIRNYFAELLLRLEYFEEARLELELLDADAQEQGDAFLKQRIQCQSKLVRLAEEEEDAYNEHLHRGIGLYLLARQRLVLGQGEGQLSVEGLLCRAAGELTLARRERREEARPCWYLHLAWSTLAQRQAAQRWLRETESRAPYSYLTPSEQRGLQLAGASLRSGRER
jgi:Tfp pilus assembly protein PilF